MIMESTESDRAKFVPFPLGYVRSFLFGDVESTASVLSIYVCVPNFTITNLTVFTYSLTQWTSFHYIFL